MWLLKNTSSNMPAPGQLPFQQGDAAAVCLLRGKHARRGAGFWDQ